MSINQLRGSSTVRTGDFREDASEPDSPIWSSMRISLDFDPTDKDEDMALRWDPEFAAAAAPIFEMMGSMPEPPVNDWQSRRTMVKERFGALLAGLPSPPGIEVTQYKVKSFDGVEIEVYRIKKEGVVATPSSAVLNIHGGGMIAGDATMFALAPKMFASLTDIQFFDIEYRLAPEVQHTALVDDCYAALTWLHEHADEFNVDRNRIGVYGASAGGGIAAGLCLMARDRNLQPPLAKAVLVYPMLDYKSTVPVPDLDKFLVWSVNSNITGWTALLGDRIQSGDVSPYASPSHVKDVTGLPSTYIDCGTLDLFRDEDTMYAARLAAANVDVEFHLYPGVPHAFEVIAPNISVTQQSAANRLKALQSF